MTDDRGAIEEIADELEPTLREEFLAAVQDIASSIAQDILVRAIADQDVAAILDALQLDEKFWWPLKEAIRSGFNKAGLSTLKALVSSSPRARGFALRARWEGDNPRAAYWAATRSSTLVKEIVSDQKLAIREVLLKAFEDRTPPREIAVQLAGKVNKTTGRREGGVLGLRSDQIAFSTRVRERVGGGVPDWNWYKGLKSRDKRLDAAVRKAWEAGKPLDQAHLSKVIKAIENNLLKQRAEMVARTEALAAVRRAQFEAVQQQIDAGILKKENVTKVWSATMDERTRDSHKELNNVSIPFDKPFVSPSTDSHMMFPGDSSLGAKGEDTIMCRCFMYTRVDWLAGLT